MNSIHVQGVTLRFPRVDDAMSFRSELRNRVMRLAGRSMPEIARSREFAALKNISFDLQEGDRLGLIGPNGAGKSTMLRMLSGSYVPTQGSVTIQGKVTTLLVAGLGMEMDRSGYDNIYTCGLLLGLPMDRIDEIRADIVEFCDLGEHIHYPVRTYSSGMLVRLSFALATAIEADILLIDEIIGAGDAKFAAKSKERLARAFGNARILVLASHSVPTMKQYCNKGMFLRHGEIQYLGPIDEALDRYQKWVSS